MLGGFKYSSTLVMIAVQSGEPPARCLESLEKIWGEKGTFSSSAPSLLSLLIFVWQGRRPEGNLEDAVAACAEVSGDLRKWRVCLDTQAQCRLSSLTAQGTAGRWPTRCKYDRQGYPLHAPCIVRSCKISRSLPLSPFLPFFHLCGRQSLWPIRTWSWSSLSHTKMFRQLHYQTEKIVRYRSIRLTGQVFKDDSASSSFSFSPTGLFSASAGFGPSNLFKSMPRKTKKSFPACANETVRKQPAVRSVVDPCAWIGATPW